jgi:hypothetical protein
MKEIVAQTTPRLSKPEVDEIGDRVWQKLQAVMGKHDLSLRSLYGDGWTAPALEEADLHVLLAARQLGEKATAVSIGLTVEQWTGHHPIVSLALERMEKDGLLSAEGAGDQRRFKVTELGSRALRRAKAEGKKLPVVEGLTAEEKDFIEGGAAEQNE